MTEKSFGQFLKQSGPNIVSVHLSAWVGFFFNMYLFERQLQAEGKIERQRRQRKQERENNLPVAGSLSRWEQ